jgi:hypothetical protein
MGEQISLPRDNQTDPSDALIDHEDLVQMLLLEVLELREEVTALRSRLHRLEKRSGRGLEHPTDYDSRASIAR